MTTIRFFDIFFSSLGLLILSPIICLIWVLTYLETGSPIFRQERLGINMKKIIVFKFRSMNLNTASVPTHLVNSESITKLGKFLRKSKLDELPQLVNVLLGDMSFVGPRPNLLNQNELINERCKLGVYSVRPGITGLAQINKIDMSTPIELAAADKAMIDKFSLFYYFKYIILTVFGRGSGDRVRVK